MKIIWALGYLFTIVATTTNITNVTDISWWIVLATPILNILMILLVFSVVGIIALSELNK